MRLALACLSRESLSGGFRKYILSLLPLLRADPRLRALDVFVPPAVIEGLVAEGLGELRTWTEDDPRKGFPRLRAEIAALHPDVVFVPSAWHIECGRPCVVMVRNMEPIEQPLRGHTLRAGLVNLARAHMARRACRRAARVIAVSHHVERTLVEKWGLDPARVGVVYHGVDVPPQESSRPAAVPAIPDRGFLFTAGSIRPARGLEDAIDALGLMGERGPVLVIAGKPDPDTEAHLGRLQERASRRGIASRVLWAGGLGRPEMDWCFEHCAAFVMTSRTEACPNTVLEAMSHGCLSISIDRPPMTELLGDSAVYYRGGDARDLAGRIEAVLRLGEEAIGKSRSTARARAAQFPWSLTAERTIGELEKAVRSQDSLQDFTRGRLRG
jgi:glycosyltransferase involved in cell wall biosynthesis